MNGLYFTRENYTTGIQVHMKSYTTCMYIYIYIHITHCLYRCIQRWWHLQEDTEKTTERKIYVCIYLHTHTHSSIRYSYTHPVKRKTLQIMLWMSHKKSLFQAIFTLESIYTRTKKRRIQGLHQFALATRDPSFMINFTYLTGRLQFLNSTPQPWWKDNFICCFTRAAWRSLGIFN